MQAQQAKPIISNQSAGIEPFPPDQEYKHIGMHVNGLFLTANA